MSGGRRNSIGTLTGWQLLAKQHVDREDGDGDSADDSSSDGDDAEAETDNSRQRLHPRSLSNTSTVSEESGGLGGGSGSAVTPRPHQWLYKEYKILDEIGSGGFGRVCRARRLADGRVVVVKEINTTSLTAKQKAATMDEVLVLNKLNHPNIVKYHDCYMDAVYINIVMEYCNGGDLAGLIKGREGRLMPEDEVMSLFVQICLAMHYVHSAGVLHRDLKSSNVLITQGDNFGGMPLLKLGDFGVAKMNSAESSMASTIVGTPQYLSPEMCDNKPYGKKSDVWALGCILYELCSLKKAFDGGTGGISGIIIKIMRGTYEPLPVGYSDEMRGLVKEMLNIKPRKRPGVGDVLKMPYVRRHLGLYLDWARNVPQAHPQILQTTLGDLWPRRAPQDAPQQQQQQQQQQQPPMLQTIGSGGSCSSLDTQHAPLSPQQQQHVDQQQQQQQGGSSSSAMSLGAPAAAVMTPQQRISGTGSSSSATGLGSAISSTELLLRQGSNASNSARSGSATPRAAAAAAAAGQLAPAGSNAAEADQQQQQQQQGTVTPPSSTTATAGGSGGYPPSMPRGSPLSSANALSTVSSSSPLSDSHMPAASCPSGGLPPGSLSGWLGGDNSLQTRQQIHQRVMSQQQHQQHDQGMPLPLQQQQKQQQQMKQQQLLMERDRQQADQQQQQQQGYGILGSNSEPSPQQQQQQLRQPRMSCPSPRELLVAAGQQQQQQYPPQQQQQQQHPLETPTPPLSTNSGHSADLATGWAYPSVSAEMRRPPTSRTSLAQEQLEGLKAIWDLKAKLQIRPDATGSPGAEPLLRDFLQQQQQQQVVQQVVQQQQHQQQQQGVPFWAINELEADAAMHI